MLGAAGEFEPGERPCLFKGGSLEADQGVVLPVVAGGPGQVVQEGLQLVVAVLFCAQSKQPRNAVRASDRGPATPCWRSSGATVPGQQDFRAHSDGNGGHWGAKPDLPVEPPRSPSRLDNLQQL